MNTLATRDVSSTSALEAPRLGPLDGESDEAFDRYTRIASELLHVPVSLVSLVDGEQQFFNSAVGLDERWASLRDTLLSFSFCQNDLALREPIVVTDTRLKAGRPKSLALGEHGVISYLGVPIRTREGQAVGSFYAISDTPRVWSESEIALMKSLATGLTVEIELKREIHLHRTTMEALAARERLLTALLDHSPLGIQIQSPDGASLRTNDAHRQLFGGGPAEQRPARNTARKDLSSLRPGTEGRFERAPRRDIFQAAAAAPPGPCELELGTTRNPLVVEQTIFPVVAASGNRPEMVISMSQDITDRKRADLRLVAAHKAESIATLAAGVAHDFNNLLSVVLANIELAGDSENLSPQDRGYLNDAALATRRAAELTLQLLAYTSEAGPGVHDLNLGKLSRELLQLLRISMRENVSLDFDLTEDLPDIKGNASQLRQVIMNLVLNASEAIPADVAGTVRLRGRTRQVGPGAREVILEVSDDGCGMPQEVLGHIFEPFFTTKSTGRGLGLAAIHTIVKDVHRGEIEVESEPGFGTKFRIRFPAVDVEKAE